MPSTRSKIVPEAFARPIAQGPLPVPSAIRQTLDEMQVYPSQEASSWMSVTRSLVPSFFPVRRKVVIARPSSVLQKRTTTKKLELGRRWERFVREMKQIKNLYVEFGWKMDEIRKNHPELSIWT